MKIRHFQTRLQTINNAWTRSSLLPYMAIYLGGVRKLDSVELLINISFYEMNWRLPSSDLLTASEVLTEHHAQDDVEYQKHLRGGLGKFTSPTFWWKRESRAQNCLPHHVFTFLSLDVVKPLTAFLYCLPSHFHLCNSSQSESVTNLLFTV